jgi:hypothetical protein
MKEFKLLAFKRKLAIFCSFESFFKMHSWATEQKKMKKGQKTATF